MSRRLVLYLCKHKKPISFFSSSSNVIIRNNNNNPNPRYLYTQSTTTTTSVPKDQQPPPSDNTPPPSSDGTTKMNSWNYLKYGAYATLAGLSGTVAYHTYAYSADEVDSITKDIRNSVKQKKNKDASSLEKFQALLYSAAMTVPSKCIDIYLELRRSIEDKVREYTEPYSDKLLPDLAPELKGLGVMTLVVDLNETLIYSDWKRERGWRTFKRPGVDAFLERLAQFYEIVVFSDQQESMFVDPICERLNQKGTITYRLGRTATKYQNGKHYKDLSKLNRDPAKVIYVSGHALETALQPDNCLEIKPWKLEEGDTALLDLVPFLEFLAYRRPQDIRKVLESYRGCDVATEFHERQRKLVDEQRKTKKTIWSR
ncbi:hypothetical protein IFM89_011185 [Coptis chinensis]|uniref:Mitochondrial import inner membrane translocase subunit TIM50 n=1 Tax=Coptis chinensis TaxID=261450 RepID=A0A835HX50_9MAGN|nr:hypothetical protein IFM89_011185 [Coptis chinensis]